ncbi:glycosyltransferase family 2 protein [Reyranella sp.]|uniref:glycosyltransferase family 2 protein n=1 Tax=Reyranella sp. TaxID=1929291 RepID=UPI003D102C9B
MVSAPSALQAVAAAAANVSSLRVDGLAHGAAASAQYELTLRKGAPAEGWLWVRYRTTLYGSAGRPVIRFEGDAGETEQPMSAALFGIGEWIGRVPGRTRRIHIGLPAGCSTAHFSLLQGLMLSGSELFALARNRSPAKALLAAALRLVGCRVASDGLLMNLFGATPLQRYHEWRVANERGLDVTGLEARRDSWDRGPHIRVILFENGEGDDEAVKATVASLERQVYPHWSLVFVGADIACGGERRVVCVERNAKAEVLWRGLDSSDIILPISAGDTISDYAMAALVEFAGTRPDHTLFYADEDSIDAGRYVAPELKPDWSPIFHRASPFVGRAIYARCRALDAHGQLPLGEMLRPATWDALFAASERPVGHIRRVLLTKVWKEPSKEKRIAIAKPALPAATATLIVPTRDRADLMAACLASLEKTAPRDFDLLIVDNGSTEPAARRLLDRARAHPRVRVLSAEGPFNFSALCNYAAECAESRVLVFLNNDTEVMRPDWLGELTGLAMQPEIGAVGAKLVYPSGRLQHGGLVLGLGGYAAHIDIGALPAYPGYLNRLAVPHEVSAVTGACLAVEKRKFDAIGGFDAERYPVELGDVDLCLRLAKRGWKTVFTPDVVLKHKESASRGRSHVAKRYAAERRHFLAGWKDVLFDDPFFHPALSLTARRTSLDH